MLNSGEKIALCATTKINILTRVVQVKWSVPSYN